MNDKKLTTASLVAKAERACSSARVLLDLGDVDGATSRAYYAMFDAAGAALLASGSASDPNVTRTHSGLIGAFGLHLVNNGLVPKEMGQQLNRAEGKRQVADYNGYSVEVSDAREMVEQAETFVALVRGLALKSLVDIWKANLPQFENTGAIRALSDTQVIQDAPGGQYVVWERQNLQSQDLVIGKKVTIFPSGQVKNLSSIPGPK